jgi:hypothetical protein
MVPTNSPTFGQKSSLVSSLLRDRFDYQKPIQSQRPTNNGGKGQENKQEKKKKSK